MVEDDVFGKLTLMFRLWISGWRLCARLKRGPQASTEAESRKRHAGGDWRIESSG